MVALLFAALLQAPQTPVELPVSLDRVRAGLARPGRFERPLPRPRTRPLFRVEVEQWVPFETDPWESTSIVPPWVRPHRPAYQYEFLSMVTPEAVRGPTLHPCCNVTPLLGKVGELVTNAVRSVKKARAKRELERVMREAGIKKN
jgi:hypothetical protein